MRLARPDDWARDNHVALRTLSAARRCAPRMRTVVEPAPAADARTVTDKPSPTAASRPRPSTIQVVSTGVTNRFGRLLALASRQEIDAAIESSAGPLPTRGSVISSSVAEPLAVARQPTHGLSSAALGDQASIFPGERALPNTIRAPGSRYLASTSSTSTSVLHRGHRAVVPEGFACDEITHKLVRWSTGRRCRRSATPSCGPSVWCAPTPACDFQAGAPRRTRLRKRAPPPTNACPPRGFCHRRWGNPPI